MRGEPAQFESVFLEALEQPAAAERAAYLDAACAGDTFLRQRVEALLRAHVDAGGFLEKPPVGLVMPPEVPHDGQAERDTQRARLGRTAGPEPGGPLPFPLDFLGRARAPGQLGTLGPYEVSEVIGYGGMGVVLKAQDSRLGRVVAIKVLAPGLVSHLDARRRFLREARAVAAVRHEHVVTLHDIEESARLPYMVMEYVAGHSLQQQLDRRGAFAPNEVVRVGRQVAAGLAAAHARGLVHRDVKPANILIEEATGCVKITDFGLARAVDDASLTRTGLVAGTPQYMAPEQAQGHPVDARSDLFGLGGVLYALCTGRPPFQGDTTPAVLHQICNDPHRPLAEVRPETPAWLADLIDRLLEKDPAQRPSSAAEVADLLGQPTAELRKPAPARKRRRRRWIGVAVAGVLAVAAVAYPTVAWLSRTGSTPGDPDAAPAGPADTPQPPGPTPQLFGEVRRIIAVERLNALALAPDGKVVYGACVDNTIYAWDLTNGESRGQFHGHKAPVSRLAVSPNGTRLASCGGDRTVRVWDTASGQELVQVALKVPVWRLAYSPDGKHLLAAFQGAKFAAEFAKKNPGLEVDWRYPVVFEAATGKPVRSFSEVRSDFYWSVAYSADGKQAAVGTNAGPVLVWDTVTGKQRWELKGPRGPIHALAFSRDGARLFSGGNSGWFVCWNLADGKPIHNRNFGWPVSAFALGAEETWLVAAGPLEIPVWDSRLLGSKAMVRLPGHDAPTTGVALLPGEEYAVSCSYDATVRLWKLPPRRPPELPWPPGPVADHSE